MEEHELAEKLLQDHFLIGAALIDLQLRHLTDEARSRVNDAIRNETGHLELRTRVESSQTELVLVPTDGTEAPWLRGLNPRKLHPFERTTHLSSALPRELHQVTAMTPAMGKILMSKIETVRALSTSIVLFAAAHSTFAKDLTSDVKAKVFGPPSTVHIASGAVTIPLTGTDRQGNFKCPYVTAFVNSKGPFTFLIDTGGSYTLVSSKVVDAARPPVMFDRGGKRDVVSLETIKIGGVTLGGTWAIHDDDFGVDGVLGINAFGSSNIVFDLAHRQLLVSDHPVKLAKAFELPYDMTYGVPTIPLKIGSRTAAILIDTGDDAYGLELRTGDLGDAKLVHAPVGANDVLNGATVQATRVSTLSESVFLGPMESTNAVVGINDSLPIGDLGFEVLRQFRIEFQPARKMVIFQPLFAGRRFRIPGNRTPGFAVSFDGTKKISRVEPGSAAATAGLAVGDTILSFDGRNAVQLTPRSWQLGIARSVVRVSWAHEGAVRAAVLPVSEVR